MSPASFAEVAGAQSKGRAHSSSIFRNSFFTNRIVLQMSSLFLPSLSRMALALWSLGLLWAEIDVQEASLEARRMRRPSRLAAHLQDVGRNPALIAPCRSFLSRYKRVPAPALHRPSINAPRAVQPDGKAHPQMDSYADQKDEAISKKIGQNFCSILWAGVEEHDKPELYFYYNDCANQIHPDNRELEAQLEMMMNVSKRLVGMQQMTFNLCGKPAEQFPTQTFHSQRQITVVRQIFPYHIVLSINKPCSERAARRAVDYVTLIAFQDCHELSQFTPHKKEALVPQQLSQNFDEVRAMLCGFLVRFFEDEAGREYLDYLHPVYLPKDIITPHLFALQQVRVLQKAHPGASIIVQKTGRILLSTAGSFMTNVAALMASCVENCFNRRVHYPFGSYFKSEPAQQKYQNAQSPNFSNQIFSSFSHIYVSVFMFNGMALILISPQPTALKQNLFQAQLQLLNEKLQPQGPTPPVFARSAEQTFPVFAPIPGGIDVAGIDPAGIFRAFRGVQNLSVTDGKVDYGVGCLDGGYQQYFIDRGCLEVFTIAQQDEAETSRSFIKQGEFYAFGDNPTSQGGLLSGGKKIKPLIMTTFKADESGVVQAASAAPVNEGDQWAVINKQIVEAQETYLRISWQ